MIANQSDEQRLRADALLNWINTQTNLRAEALDMVSGDASFRRYFRFKFEGCSYIAVDAPPEKENNHAFFHIAKRYFDAGVQVPEIKAVDLALGFWVLEDFGDVLLANRFDSKDVQPLYAQALEALRGIQHVMTTDAGTLPAFDDALLDAEFHLFNHWLIEVHLKLGLTDTQWQTIHEAQEAIRRVFKAQPQVGVHRDYHSRNLMVLPDDSIGIIDFQDAVTGPVTYDAVSLLRDCYVVWPDAMVDTLISEWREGHFPQYDAKEFARWFDFVGMQRHIKASGIFCRLCHRDGKQGYLADIPRTLEYVVKFGRRYGETRDFADLVASMVIPAVVSKLAA
ncbi:aminoglycoside phosphotransferase family protein [Planctobacterium marinum]|uniref:Cell wall phosphotransferase n=1 Tax=Planctobacterium marinum TaxID=1631968 RepID=A0AA48KPH2_9ALTE|nr:cell wall phosphotransferase [Planctobacterium marinum]